jgi:predicted nucleic acid-binding protein
MTFQDGFVLDCSLALAWCFPDEQAPYPQSVLNSLAATRAVVPSLWHLEVANALLVGERRGRCTAENVTTWTGFLAALPIRIDDATMMRAWSDTLTIARTQRLSAYDASYLELALRLRLPLAALDAPMNAAATTLGVSLYAPV